MTLFFNIVTHVTLRMKRHSIFPVLRQLRALVSRRLTRDSNTRVVKISYSRNEDTSGSKIHTEIARVTSTFDTRLFFSSLHFPRGSGSLIRAKLSQNRRRRRRSC